MCDKQRLTVQRLKAQWLWDNTIIQNFLSERGDSVSSAWASERGHLLEVSLLQLKTVYVNFKRVFIASFDEFPAVFQNSLQSFGIFNDASFSPFILCSHPHAWGDSSGKCYIFVHKYKEKEFIGGNQSESTDLHLWLPRLQNVGIFKVSYIPSACCYMGCLRLMVNLCVLNVLFSATLLTHF